MVFNILTQITIIFHFPWIVFIVFGFVFVIKRSRIAWLHLGGLLFSLIINLFGWYCPLTYLEYYLQVSPVTGAGHKEPFIIRYLMPVIYPDLPEGVIRIGEILFVCLNLIVYAGVAMKSFWFMRRLYVIIPEDVTKLLVFLGQKINAEIIFFRRREMLIFVKRLIALILIPAGLVLLFAPLDTFRNTYLEKDFVFLIAEPVSSEDKDVETLPLLTREQLEPYTQILTTVLARKERVETYRPSPKVADDILGLESLGNTLSQMDGVSLEEGERYKKELAQQQKRVHDSKAKMRKIRLTGFSYLQKQWETEATAISIEEWEQMKESLSFSDNDQTLFLFENTLFRGVVRYDYSHVNLPVPGLALGRKIAGAASLIMGLLLMTGLYLKKQGIMIAKTWSVLLWDIIVICGSVFFLYGALDLLFMKLFETGMGTEEFIQFMGVFWVFLGIPAIALFISASAAQAVTINEKGVYLDGLFSKIFVSWDDLKDIEVSEIHSVKKAGGILAPKQLMKIMCLEGETSSITLMEPPLKSTKKRILDALLTHAPEKWEGIIEDKGKAWQAFF